MLTGVTVRRGLLLALVAIAAWIGYGVLFPPVPARFPVHVIVAADARLSPAEAAEALGLHADDWLVQNQDTETPAPFTTLDTLSSRVGDLGGTVLIRLDTSDEDMAQKIRLAVEDVADGEARRLLLRRIVPVLPVEAPQPLQERLCDLLIYASDNFGGFGLLVLGPDRDLLREYGQWFADCVVTVGPIAPPVRSLPSE